MRSTTSSRRFATTSRAFWRNAAQPRLLALGLDPQRAQYRRAKVVPADGEREVDDLAVREGRSKRGEGLFVHVPRPGDLIGVRQHRSLGRIEGVARLPV